MTDKTSVSGAEWSRLADTYWCVPPVSLPALRLDVGANTLSWLADQTVWHVTGYREGYFWGVSATLMRGSDGGPVPFTMVGSVTPEGAVYITFVRQGARSGGSATIGVGSVVPYQGEWSFEMQMSTGQGSVTSHWAHMVPVRPGDPAWDSLPGVGISVSEMLAGCEVPTMEGDAS